MTADLSLYVWGAYGMGIALALTELALLRVRYRAIRGHLGWGRRQARHNPAPPGEPASPAGVS